MLLEKKMTFVRIIRIFLERKKCCSADDADDPDNFVHQATQATAVTQWSELVHRRVKLITEVLKFSKFDRSIFRTF